MVRNTIIKEIQLLPEFAQMEVLNYLLFLKNKHTTNTLPAKAKRPYFGCGKIKIEMAEDFDAPLYDFKEYM